MSTPSVNEFEIWAEVIHRAESFKRMTRKQRDALATGIGLPSREELQLACQRVEAFLSRPSVRMLMYGPDQVGSLPTRARNVLGRWFRVEPVNTVADVWPLWPDILKGSKAGSHLNLGAVTARQIQEWLRLYGYKADAVKSGKRFVPGERCEHCGHKKPGRWV